jgi:hypothetical protein
MPAEIKYGIVVDNKDITETGKIRVLLMEQDVPASFRSKSIVELKKFLANADAVGNYIPWSKSSSTKSADPYLTEPFLPKQINLIPEEGQLVKVMIYEEAQYREYVGPAISSLENQKENYVNSLNAFKYNTKKDLIKTGYVTRVQDFSLYGNNSQLILSDKEVFLRTNHQTTTGTKQKNSNLSLLQQSTFNTTLTVEKKKRNVVQEPDKLISHLLEITVHKKFRSFLNEPTLIATLQLKSALDLLNNNGKRGLLNKSYSPKAAYEDAPVELEFQIQTDDIASINSFIEEIKQGLLDKKISQLANTSGGVTELDTPNGKITITDNRTMTRTFTEITDRKEVDVISFIVRSKPGQSLYTVNEDTLTGLGVVAGFKETNPTFYRKELTNLSGINEIINKFNLNTTIESKLMQEGPRTVEVDDNNFTVDQRKDSFSVQASNKILMLSTQVTPNLISSNPSQYGLTQQELTNLVDPSQLKTYSLVRGELMVQTLLRLVDLFLAHGHSLMNTTKNSLEEETRAELIKLKEELTKKVNPDLSGGPKVLNQYIRVN